MTVNREVDAADSGASSATGRGALALGVLAGALGLDIGSLNVINAALPQIGAHFDLTSTALQWTMTAYAVTFAGFLLFGGRVADVLGRRRIFVVGVAMFTVAALAGAVAPNLEILIVARAVQGLGAALSGPAALALLSEVFPEGPPRNRALSVYAAVGAASGSGGFVIGGLLTDLFGWRSVFTFSVVLGVLILLPVRAALPASARRPHPLDLPGAVTVTGGLLLVVFGVSRGGSNGWTDLGTVLSLVAAAVLLVAFVLWERRAPEPLLPLSIFRSVPVRAATLSAFLLYTAALGLQFFAPLYLQGVLGYSPFQSGLAIVPFSLSVFAMANFFTGRLLSELGQKPLLVVGLTVIGIGIASWAWTPVDGNYWLHMLPGLVVMGAGIGLVFPTMTAAALTEVPQQQHGVAGAVNVTAQQVGGSVGVAALVVVATATTVGAGSGAQSALPGYHAAYLVAAVACVLGSLLLAVGWRRGAAPARANP